MRRGFTLVELLATIVILAIIVLITFPLILNVIEKSRKGAAKSSALGYIDAVEKQIALNEVKGENIISDNTYDVIELNNTYKISMKGKYPTSGSIVINKKQVESANICINNYIVKYENNNAEVLNKCDNNSDTSIEATSINTTQNKSVQQSLDEINNLLN